MQGVQRTLHTLTAAPQVAAYASQRVSHRDVLAQIPAVSNHGQHQDHEPRNGRYDVVRW